MQILNVGQIFAAFLSNGHTDGNLPVREREFGAVLIYIADRRDADSLAERRSSDAQISREVHMRADQNFRPLQIAVKAGRANFLYRSEERRVGTECVSTCRSRG